MCTVYKKSLVRVVRWIGDYLRSTGFYHVSRIRVIRGFYPLLAALVERWRPKTHTFVLSVDEAIVTLEDIAHIFGLPIDGKPVSGWTDSSSDFLQSQSIAIFGREPVISSSLKSYIKLGWVRRIRDTEPLDTKESIKRYIRCQIFCLLGSTLFTDKSTAYAHTNIWAYADKSTVFVWAYAVDLSVNRVEPNKKNLEYDLSLDRLLSAQLLCVSDAANPTQLYIRFLKNY
nr:protein MAIN-LIKE 2-like [Arachis hypogaea]